MMSGFFKAAWATQSVAALMLDFSSSLRSIARAVEAMKIAFGAFSAPSYSRYGKPSLNAGLDLSQCWPSTNEASFMRAA
jgi:hypothetical protein